jgi:Recombination endonuclease VII
MNCVQPECPRLARAKGLCSLHYQRSRAGLPLDSPVVLCGVCGEPCRTGSSYGFCHRTEECRRARSNAYYRANKGQIRKAAKQRYDKDSSRAIQTAAAYREANREQIRIRKRDTAYGLKPGEFDAMRSAQGNRCKGCKREVRLYIDHDHTCCPKQPTCGRCNRGLLCEQCNWVLGFAKDNPATLRALANHLEETP